MHDDETTHTHTFGINTTHHHIVGESRDPDPVQDCFRRATIWPEGNPLNPQALPFIDPGTSEDDFANAISEPIEWMIAPDPDEVHVVGRDEILNAATLWRGNPGDWTAYDLNEISCYDVSPPVEFALHEAKDVNRYGWIVGWMTVHPDTPDEAIHAFLLIPRNWCPADLNLDGVVDGSDLLILLSRWGECPQPKDCCLADLNGDCVVDGSDLLILLASWGPCPGFEHLDDPLTLSELIDESRLTDDDWDEFMSVMTGSGSQAEKDNYLCWMQTYLMQCVLCPKCPGRDPFAQ